MIKDIDAGSRNQGRTEANNSAVTYSGSQSLLIPNAAQNRYSLPVPIPARSASIVYESLPVSPVSSTPPRLDLLPDLAIDGLQRTSTFRDGLEKAVNDINTKYGDSTTPFINSTSPTNSIAVRDKNTFRPRYMVPIYVDSPTVRPVIGELWTTLKGQNEPLRPCHAVCDISDDYVTVEHPLDMPPQLDTQAGDLDQKNASIDTSIDKASTPTGPSNGDESQKALSNAEAADQNSVHSDTPDFEANDSHAKVASQDSTAVNQPESDASDESTDEDSESQASASTSALSHKRSREPSSSATKYSAANEDDLEDALRQGATNQERKSSAPSVAALVSKFRRMQQSPGHSQQGDGTPEQDQESLESNSKFIQSYRQRSEDGEVEDSMLSTVSSDNAGEGRPTLVVC